MVNTQTTRISATVFHKHKYTSNPIAAPSDVVIVTAKNLTKALKRKLPRYIQESLLAKLTHLSRILYNDATDPKSDLTAHRPVVPKSKILGNTAPRRSPCSKTHVD